MFAPTQVGKRPWSFPQVSPRIWRILAALVVVGVILATAIGLVTLISSRSSGSGTPALASASVDLSEPMTALPRKTPSVVIPEVAGPAVIADHIVEEVVPAPIQEPATAPEAFAPVIPLLPIEWRVVQGVQDISAIPPHGASEPFTGTIDSFVGRGMSAAKSGIPERVAVVQSAMPERNMSGDFIAIHRDAANEQLLIAVINLVTRGPFWTRMDPILFVSDDGGVTWRLCTVPPWKHGAPLISEVRRAGDQLFVTYAETEWLTN